MFDHVFEKRRKLHEALIKTGMYMYNYVCT